MVGHEQHPSLGDSLDAVDDGAEVAAVEQRGGREGVAARVRIEAEGVVAAFVLVARDPRDARIDVFADELLHGAHEAIPDATTGASPEPAATGAEAGEGHEGRGATGHGASSFLATRRVNALRVTTG